MPLKSTLSSKGQITVPKEVRDRYDIAPGDTVEFRLAEDGPELRVIKRPSIRSLKGILKSEVKYRGRAAERQAAEAYRAREAEQRD